MTFAGTQKRGSAVAQCSGGFRGGALVASAPPAESMVKKS